MSEIVRKLSTDEIALVSSFLIGEPWQVRMKENKLLKRIQKRYKYTMEVDVSEIERYSDDEEDVITTGIQFNFDGYVKLSYLDANIDKIVSEIKKQIAKYEERGARRFETSMMLSSDAFEDDFTDFTLDTIKEAIETTKNDASWQVPDDMDYFILTVLLYAHF